MPCGCRFSRLRCFLPLVLAAGVFALASCNFFVDPVLTSISVSPSNPILTKGHTQQFTASGVNNDGSTRSNVTATWSTSDSAGTIVTITPGGLATAVGVGSATITATADSLTGSTTMTVTAAALTSIAITGSTTLLSASGTLGPTSTSLTAKGTFADGTSMTLNNVSWQSSNTSVATVDSSGTVTAKGQGSVTITATSGSVQGSYAMTVTL